MTTLSATRNEEIQTIHKKYADFYRIGGGLTLVFMGVLIGAWLFGQNQLALPDNMLGYVTNVATELLSVVATIVVIDQLNQRRERENYKQDLIRQAGSIANDIAVDAVEQLRKAGWLTGEDSVLKGADLEGANLEKARMQSANLQQADLGAVNLQAANLESAKLQQARLRHANLQQADMRQANLQAANLGLANLQQAHLRSANLQEAVLMSANLQEADLWYVNLQAAGLGYANLQQAILTYANLQAAGLVYANLQQAHLRSVNLQEADLVYANLQQADLVYANLQQTELRQANLQQTELRQANLQQANLSQANLRDAKDIETAQFDEKTVLPDAEYRGVNDKNEPIYDKYWTADTDMTRYTNPDHPDFWEPEWVKWERKQAKDK